MKIEILSAQSRLKNALKAMALFFALAIASVFIPVLHFVTVPVLVLVAFFAGYKEFKKNIQISELNVKCESCGADVDFSGRTSEDYLMKYCPACNRQVSTQLKP